MMTNLKFSFGFWLKVSSIFWPVGSLYVRTEVGSIVFSGRFMKGCLFGNSRTVEPTIIVLHMRLYVLHIVLHMRHNKYYT